MASLSTPIAELRSRYDVIVIGSGYGGAIAAYRMAERAWPTRCRRRKTASAISSTPLRRIRDAAATFRIPTEHRLDARITKRLRAASRSTISVSLDVLNVFNVTNFADVNRVFGTGAYPSAP